MDVATQVLFNLKTKVSFGVGAFAGVGAEAAGFGKAVLIVTGRGSMRRSGVTERLVRQVVESGARPVLYEEASPNPTTVEVDRGAELARGEGVEAIVGLGGGSAMDVAKGISMVLANGKPCYELCAGPLAKPGLPVVAVPTTSGTGAEVNGVAVVTEPVRKHKTALRGPAVAPAVAVVDPELCLTLPPKVTASSGMDALAHAVESYLSRRASPLSELFAERATELVLKHLETACATGDSLEARTGMALGSLMAGVTLGQAGVIVGHGVGMMLGGFFGTDHGATVGLLLPDVLDFTLPGSAGRLARLARRSGVVGEGEGLGDGQAAERLMARIRGLVGRLTDAGMLPGSLAEWGCKLDDLPRMVEFVLAQGATPNHPVRLGQAEVEGFLRRVLG